MDLYSLEKWQFWEDPTAVQCSQEGHQSGTRVSVVGHGRRAEVKPRESGWHEGKSGSGADCPISLCWLHPWRFWKPSSEQSGGIPELVWLWGRHFWRSAPVWVTIPWPHEKQNTWFRWDPDPRQATCCSFRTVRTVSSQVPLISQHQFSPWLQVPRLGLRRQQCVTIHQKMPGATWAHLLGWMAEAQWLLYDRPWKKSSSRRACGGKPDDNALLPLFSARSGKLFHPTVVACA